MKKKILVIEDEKSINYLICTVLTANQYDAIPAYSGQEACTMLQAYCPDLIILDLGLPDMNGVDIIRRFRRQSQTPIVVVSARTREQDKIEALDLGADDYITKPFSGGNCWPESAPPSVTPRPTPPRPRWGTRRRTTRGSWRSTMTSGWSPSAGPPSI